MIVRPSWVIGGRGIAVLRAPDDVDAYLRTEIGWPLRVDELVDGIELDVDAISDGRPMGRARDPRAGGPAGCPLRRQPAVLPPQRIGREVQERAAEAAGRIALALDVRGILNVQMIAPGSASS